MIGAGMGGLAVAARLAATGHQVRIVEQSDHTGGKVATVRRDGFTFDTGPSLLTLPAVYRDLFLKTARSRKTAALEDNVELIPLDPAFRYRFSDGTFLDLPGTGWGKIAAALDDAMGARAGEQWIELLKRGQRMWELTRGPFLENELAGAATLARLARSPSAVKTVAPWSTLRALGKGYLSDPRLRTLLDRYATYTGSDPRRAPAVLATIPYVEQTFGSWHIAGGIGRLAQALTARCEQWNVTISLQHRVISILTQGTGSACRATGVLVDDLVTGEQHNLLADIVVANADAEIVYRHLLSKDVTAAAPARARLDAAQPSLAGFIVLAAVRNSSGSNSSGSNSSGSISPGSISPGSSSPGSSAPGSNSPGSGAPVPTLHHNVWFPANYDVEFDAVFGSKPRPVHDPTIYACTPADPAMAPPGHTAWYLLVNAPRHVPAGSKETGVDWDTPGLAEQYGDRVLAVLAERGTDLRPNLLWHQVQTPADLERSAGAPGGSIYGRSSNGAKAAFLRAANTSPVKGLFCVGGSAHPGGGLPLVGLSAAIVSSAIGPAAGTSAPGKSVTATSADR